MPAGSGAMFVLAAPARIWPEPSAGSSVDATDAALRPVGSAGTPGASPDVVSAGRGVGTGAMPTPAHAAPSSNAPVAPPTTEVRTYLRMGGSISACSCTRGEGAGRAPSGSPWHRREPAVPTRVTAARRSRSRHRTTAFRVRARGGTGDVARLLHAGPGQVHVREAVDRRVGPEVSGVRELAA